MGVCIRPLTVTNWPVGLPGQILLPYRAVTPVWKMSNAISDWGDGCLPLAHKTGVTPVWKLPNTIADWGDRHLPLAHKTGVTPVWKLPNAITDWGDGHLPLAHKTGVTPVWKLPKAITDWGDGRLPPHPPPKTGVRPVWKLSNAITDWGDGRLPRSSQDRCRASPSEARSKRPAHRQDCRCWQSCAHYFSTPLAWHRLRFVRLGGSGGSARP